jgi:hypothetical protein
MPDALLRTATKSIAAAFNSRMAGQAGSCKERHSCQPRSSNGGPVIEARATFRLFCRRGIHARCSCANCDKGIAAEACSYGELCSYQPRSSNAGPVIEARATCRFFCREGIHARCTCASCDKGIAAEACSYTSRDEKHRDRRESLFGTAAFNSRMAGQACSCKERASSA